MSLQGMDFERALGIALNAHRGQNDSSNEPYIKHILGVWSRVRHLDEVTQLVALLHDTVEDTSVTPQQLRVNFSDDVCDAVALLTRDHFQVEPYEKYIERIAASGNRHAILVKLADLADNTSPERSTNLSEEKQAYFARKRKEKYYPAIQRLTKALEEVHEV